LRRSAQDSGSSRSSKRMSPGPERTAPFMFDAPLFRDTLPMRHPRHVAHRGLLARMPRVSTFQVEDEAIPGLFSHDLSPGVVNPVLGDFRDLGPDLVARAEVNHVLRLLDAAGI
jgi:hypothetical protein